MPTSGEYYITSKGRRFRNSLKKDFSRFESSQAHSSTEYTNPFDPHVSELQMDPDIEVVSSTDELDIEPRSHRGFISDDSPRSSTLNTLEVLDDLYKDPYGLESEGWEMDTLDWLVKHRYAKFVPFHRSLDVNFETKLKKSYRIE